MWRRVDTGLAVYAAEKDDADAGTENRPAKPEPNNHTTAGNRTTAPGEKTVRTRTPGRSAPHPDPRACGRTTGP